MATPKKTVAKTAAKAPAKKAVATKAAPAKEAVAAAPKAAAAPAVAKKAATSLEVKVYTMAGKENGTITLPADIFDAKWNADLVHQVVIGMQANARQSIAHTKFRSEVSGGGKKPWKQKGTGRARHGSNRSPIWVGGGVTHGPRAEKDYSVKINRKMRLAALRSVLSRKLKDGEVIFVESFAFSAPKTSEAKGALVAIAKASGRDSLATKRKNAAVIAFATKDAVAEKSLRNIGSIMTEEVRNLNPVDLMNKKYLVISGPQESLQVLATRFGTTA
ncbi:MAG TPA: 50S ribosomal protein L4 [Candidatus Paceibacterota bacterium]|nr:50S ribosomal protein L4 [Candidatus Paceibacterota bacterium]